MLNNIPKSGIINLWKYLIGVSLWLATFVGQFLSFDVYLSVTNTSSYTNSIADFGAFLSACIIGFSMALPKIYDFAAEKKFWFKTGVIATILMIVSTFSYFSIRDKYSCAFSGIYIVMGDNPSQEYLTYTDQHKNDNHRCATLEKFAGNVERMYLDTRDNKFLILTLNFTICWMILSLVIVSLYNVRILKK